MASRLSRSLVASLQQQQYSRQLLIPRFFSGNNSSSNIPNLDNLVSGVTSEMVANDPVLMDYMKSNFPEYFEDNNNRKEEEIATVVTNWGERRRAIPKPILNIRSIPTLLRCPETEEGSNRCFPMREREGLIPGVIYGSNPTIGAKERIFVKTPRSIIQSEMDRFHHLAFVGRVYDLTVYETPEQFDQEQGGTVHRVVPRSVQLHPVNDMVYCCNFLRYYPGRPIKVPVTLVNEEESPALKRDGFLIPINKTVEVVVDEGVAIPEVLEVECSGLQFKQVIRLDRVMFPEGVRPSEKVLKHKDFMIGPIHGGRGGGADLTEGEGDEE
ncbi:protein L25 [Seminavis robusta]|uniref:Protein L25 n=1 Tax=Seminavis robusta TaxID=568900 RepID=A0A9N8DQT5_9STRA|nr:protein L25 [Seminavis robusta]|eukprot:Sro216_g089360.1 protein L25 (326) ;mRNA; r:38934-40009